MNRPWADSSGLPTKHAIRAALRVAVLIDPQGSPVADARETYWHVASGGTLPPPDLDMGERLLVDLGLAVVTDEVLYRTQQLDDLIAGDEDFAIAALLVASTDVIPQRILAQLAETFNERIAECVEDEQQQQDTLAIVANKFDASYRTMVGEIGEEHVFTEARQELASAGHGRLARQVRRVSLISDAYGYDITAPRVHGTDRLFEVKSTTSIRDGTVTIFVSRHEADIGAQRDNWMLLICHVIDIDHRVAQTLGWLRYADIQAQLPTNAPDGRWESASLAVRLDRLSPGLPSAFL